MFYDKQEVTGLLIKYRDDHHDKQALDRLYTIMHPVGLVIAKSYFNTKNRQYDYSDCEDAVSRAFIKIIQKIDTFVKDNNGGAWILKIVQNECFQIMRERKRMVSTDEINVADTNNYADIVLTEILESEFIGKLCPIDREVYFATKNDYSAKDISKLVRKSVSTVKRRQKSNREKFALFIDEKSKKDKD